MAAEQGDFVRRVEEMVGINKVQGGTVIAGVAHGVFVENDVVAPAVHNFRWCDARVVLRVVWSNIQKTVTVFWVFDYTEAVGGAGRSFPGWKRTDGCGRTAGVSRVPVCK